MPTTDNHRIRPFTARLYLDRLRQLLTGKGCLVREEPPLEPARVSRRALLAAEIEPAKGTPKDPEQGAPLRPFDPLRAQDRPEQGRRAARVERLMALLRGEEQP